VLGGDTDNLTKASSTSGWTAFLIRRPNPQTDVSKLQNRERAVLDYEAQAIARVLKVKVAWLFGEIAWISFAFANALASMKTSSD
jgi:hypothetical protein